ncbi:hypothetical protein HHK36_006589 [Tetracentron sinense]|uniref:Ubiquitin-like protease family profile domain-containing protein n=1 Tax=Tetracentron sinense TaxID=13715 RepID=A0A834ZIA0_TETSI|nr:hypothetical protein HHK36_006589 [Tetracentron sinense]
MEDEVLRYKGVVLRRSDLDILRNPCYVDDDIINFYFSYLSSFCCSQDILLVPPAVSCCLASDEDLKDHLEHLKLSGKKLVIFSINNCDFSCGEGGGTHWSLLAYYRDMNAFVHHDSMEGTNRWAAEKLYEAVKGSVGAASVSSASASKLSSKGRNKNKKGSAAAAKFTAAPTSAPCFIEHHTPQQLNGYDCGLYVMAIAKVICEWFENECKGKGDQWFSAIEDKVNSSVEDSMRSEILSLIQEMKNDN